MIGRMLIFILISTTFCRAQLPGKTIVFKVRVPAVECTILCQENFFWLEIENPVRIKIKGGRNLKTKVEVTDGKIMSVKGDIYYIRFTRPGSVAVSVYQSTPFGRELIAVKKLEVKNPVVYFCGIKIDSVAKGIKLIGPSIYAYSQYYKKNMDVTSFEMVYIKDTTKKVSGLYKKDSSNKLVKDDGTIRMKSDTCIITKEMKKIILGFQPNYSSIYLHNIVCCVPDGSKRILDPIRLDIVADTADRKKFSLIYSVRRKIL